MRKKIKKLYEFEVLDANTNKLLHKARIEAFTESEAIEHIYATIPMINSAYTIKEIKVK